MRGVAGRTGLHKATVSRLLRTLVAAGLIERARPVGYASQNERAHFPTQVTACQPNATETRGAELLVFDNRFDAEVDLRNVDTMAQKPWR